MQRLLLLCFVLSACGLSRQLGRSARETVLATPVLQTAHVGISIFEPATGKRWYDYQGDKYFVPASNTKIPTCYAAMKYLGDSLVAARLAVGKDDVVELYPSGDPTFLHPDFSFQPLFTILKNERAFRWTLKDWKAERWGSGWSWNDFDAAYMAERSAFPIYGNVMTVRYEAGRLFFSPRPKEVFWVRPDSLGYDAKTGAVNTPKFGLERSLDGNSIFINPAQNDFVRAAIPFRMEIRDVCRVLEDTLHLENVSTFGYAPGYSRAINKTVIHSQPTDSLLRPLMHRSDNFFAEQALLMVSNERLGYMSDEKIIDTLLKTDFKDLPQKPRWADGSGLSRYNLFSPQDFVFILNKMKNEFGMARVKNIFATGGEGTLSNYYRSDSTFVYAKTGTLSGVVALSGFLTTKKGKELIFSVLVNNHNGSATEVRRAVEKFVQGVRERY